MLNVSGVMSGTNSEDGRTDGLADRPGGKLLYAIYPYVLQYIHAIFQVSMVNRYGVMVMKNSKDGRTD